MPAFVCVCVCACVDRHTLTHSQTRAHKHHAEVRCRWLACVVLCVSPSVYILSPICQWAVRIVFGALSRAEKKYPHLRKPEVDQVALQRTGILPASPASPRNSGGAPPPGYDECAFGGAQRAFGALAGR